MLILCLKTDQPEAELTLYSDNQLVQQITWQAHRQLAETIHTQIRQLLSSNNYDLQALQGIVLYKGPGSFTGLRISAAVANALANGLGVPIIGESGDAWIHNGIAALLAGTSDEIVVPEYGAEARTTTQKK